MIRNHLIVIPFNLPWEWSTDYTNQTAYILSKDNIVICYMWSESYSLKEYSQKHKLPQIIKKHSKNLYLYYPIFIIPGRRFKIVSNLNEKLNFLFLKLLIKFFELTNQPKGKMLWIFDPGTFYITNYLGKDWKKIYDCVDFWSATGKTKKEMKIIERNEKALTKSADLVTAISKVLQKYLSKMTTKKVHLVPQGFRIKDFEKITPSYRNIKRGKPIIGFAGGVNNRIDYNFLLKLVKRNPKWDFAVWGPLLEKEQFDIYTRNKFNQLLSRPNLITGEVVKREQIPGILKQFDVAMIPYDPSQDFNRYCYPMKIFEFFYLGKPVVSTPIEELKRFPNLVKIGNSVAEWEEIITKLLRKPWPKKYRDEQRKLAIENSWENKLHSILRHIIL